MKKGINNAGIKTGAKMKLGISFMGIVKIIIAIIAIFLIQCLVIKGLHMLSFNVIAKKDFSFEGWYFVLMILCYCICGILLCLCNKFFFKLRIEVFVALIGFDVIIFTLLFFLTFLIEIHPVWWNFFIFLFGVKGDPLGLYFIIVFNAIPFLLLPFLFFFLSNFIIQRFSVSRKVQK
jgi:hypothetical protein